MIPEELRVGQKRQPFEPFRLVLADGRRYAIYQPDLLFIGQSHAHVGLTEDPGQVFFELAVRVDLLHIIRTEPLASSANGTS